MNSNTAKLIRQAASELPLSVIEVYREKRMLKSQVPEADQEAVAELPGDWVLYKGYVLEQLDHVKELKKYYNQYGKAVFIKKYVKWFQQHHEAMIKQHPDKLLPAKMEHPNAVNN
jgi:hypothetical protein